MAKEQADRFIVLWYSSTQVLGNMAQVKFVIDDQLLKKFKQIVIRKRGKIELTPEGEDAIRLYVEKYRGLIEERSREGEPLADAIGALNTRRTRSALDDLKRLESEP